MTNTSQAHYLLSVIGTLVSQIYDSSRLCTSHLGQVSHSIFVCWCILSSVVSIHYNYLVPDCLRVLHVTTDLKFALKTKYILCLYMVVCDRKKTVL